MNYLNDYDMQVLKENGADSYDIQEVEKYIKLSYIEMEDALSECISYLKKARNTNNEERDKISVLKNNNTLKEYFSMDFSELIEFLESASKDDEDFKELFNIAVEYCN